MYLLATHIPIHTDGTRHYTDISWQRDLILARDWLARPYGGLTLIAPSLPIHSTTEQGMGLVPIGLDDGIRVVSSFDGRSRARQFWLHDTPRVESGCRAGTCRRAHLPHLRV